MLHSLPPSPPPQIQETKAVWFYALSVYGFCMSTIVFIINLSWKAWDSFGPRPKTNPRVDHFQYHVFPHVILEVIYVPDEGLGT